MKLIKPNKDEMGKQKSEFCYFWEKLNEFNFCSSMEANELEFQG